MEELQKIEFYDAFSKLLALLSKKSGSEADNTSSYSDLLFWRVSPEVLKSARGCSLLIVVLSFIGLNPIQEVDWRERLLKIADKYNHQGEWCVVAELATTPIFTPGKILAVYFKYRSYHDFYGNDLKQMIKIKNSLKTYNPYILKKHPVKPTERKRGYNDKGHLPSPDKLRLEHLFSRRSEKKPIDEVQPTEKLFFEDTVLKRNNTAQETLVVNRTSQILPPISENNPGRKVEDHFSEEQRQRIRRLTFVFQERYDLEVKDLPYTYKHYLLWERWRAQGSNDFNLLNFELRQFIQENSKKEEK